MRDLHRRSRLVRAGLTFALVASVACKGSSPAPPPAPAAPASEGGLRPLTSRDGPASSPSLSPSLPPGHPPLSGGSALPRSAEGGPSVTGSVAVVPSLQSRVTPDDVLYVIARNAKTNAVVAVRREQGIRFPHSFQISAADVMMEGTTFTGPFDITARISRTGDAIPGKGDLEGTVKGVTAGAQGVSITIDSVRQ